MQLNWTFRDPALLREALTHTTYAHEHALPYNNERLEFLGDAVIALLVSDLLYARDPDRREGQMSQHRARVVQGSTLAEIAAGMELGAHLCTGASVAVPTSSMVEGCLEALVGAVYLDGGLEACRSAFDGWFDDAIENTADSDDHKTRLQERCHQLQLPAPEYEVHAAGPDHERVFTAAVHIGVRRAGEGVGLSKKQASQQAAKAALETL
jgi:ribonuclease-3